MIKILLLKLNSKNNTLTIHEYRTLANLLQSGISLSDSLDILKTDKNKDSITHIHSALRNGDNIDTVLFVDSKYNAIFKLFNHIYSLDKAILMVVDLEEKIERDKKEIINKLVYPLFIVIVSVVVMYFGCFKLIPNMIQMFDAMGVTNDITLLYVSQGIVILMCLFILFLVVTILLGYFMIRRNLLFDVYNKTKIDILRKIISNTITYAFISQYSIFLEKSMSTREIQEVLIYGNNSSINYRLAILLQDQYEKGMNFVEAFSSIEYFDSRAKQLIKIGYITNSLVMYVNIYLSEMKNTIHKAIKYMIFSFQGFSYISVCVCVITIATLLFEPLSILENI